MAEHDQELPEGKGFPTNDDMKRWREIFEKMLPIGNSAELIGLRLSDDGKLVGICRDKGN